MSDNFQALTDGTDQNVGDIHDSIAEFFQRAQVSFEKQKRRELGIQKNAPMPAYKAEEFPCWLYKGGVDESTGDPKVSPLLIAKYPDITERGYPVPDSGAEKSREERARKIALGYQRFPADAEKDAEDAAIAFRQSIMENEEVAKLGAVQRVWGANGAPNTNNQRDVVIDKLMAQIEALQNRFDAMPAPPAVPEGHMNLAAKHEHEAKPIAPPLNPNKGK